MAGLKTAPTPGTKVRFTADFLRNTGQYSGHDACGKWIVQDCSCEMCKPTRGGEGHFCAVNEEHLDAHNPSIPEAERPKWRHINLGNLEVCK